MAGPTKTKGSSAQDLVLFQLEDVIEAQRTVIDDLVQTVKLQEGCISQDELKHILKALQNEKESHGETKAELAAVQDKLNFAEGEIDILQRQLAREKRQFEEAFTSIREHSLHDTKKTVDLENDYQGLQQRCDEQRADIKEKDQRISNLEKQLSQLRAQHERQVSELSVARLQDLYLARELGGASSGAPTGPQRGAPPGPQRGAPPGVRQGHIRAKTKR